MGEYVQIHADIPRPLKRRLFTVLASREETFTSWVRQQAECWLKEQGPSIPVEPQVARARMVDEQPASVS